MMSLLDIDKGLRDGTLRECPHCNGYGSSLLESAPTCTRCSGTGVITNGKPEDHNNRQ